VRLADDAAARAARPTRFNAVRDAFEPIPVDETVAEHYGDTLAAARSAGRSSKATDLLIIATAAATGRVLLTLDNRQAALAQVAGVPLRPSAWQRHPSEAHSCRLPLRLKRSARETGSHNLILGEEQAFSSFGGLVAGYGNTISGREASVSGGALNSASGFYTSITGGMHNTARVEAASVQGGSQNLVEGRFASIFGGKELIAKTEYEAIP
jgi:hypothetical protein